MKYSLFLPLLALCLVGCDATADEPAGYDLLVSAEIDSPHTSIVGLRHGASPEVVVPHPGEAALRNPQCGPNGIIAYEKYTARQYVPTVWVRTPSGTRAVRDAQGDMVLGDMSQAALSPDGRKVLVSICTQLVYEGCGGRRLAIYDVAEDRLVPTEIGAHWNATWSLDGSRILYEVPGPFGQDALFVADADGSDPTRITDDGSPSIDYITQGPGPQEVTITTRPADREFVILDWQTGVRRALPLPPDPAPAWIDWSADGSSYVYTASREGNTDTYGTYIVRYTPATGSAEILLASSLAFERSIDIDIGSIVESNGCPR